MTYAHPCVTIHFKLLFNMICEHGFVPDNFGHSVTVPVVKDTRSSADADNRLDAFSGQSRTPVARGAGAASALLQTTSGRYVYNLH